MERNRTRIRVGQKLVIYTNNKGPAASSGSSGSSGSQPSTTVSDGYIIYTVRSGDNLWDISRKFSGVTMNDLMQLNGLTKNSKIYPGKKLKIKKAK